MTALYLDGSGERVRVLLDGPALRVVQPGRADGRVPLRRLSRIVVAGRVDWSGQALNACLTAGLPIVFTGRKGQTLGFALGARGEDDDLARRIEAYLERADLAACHENWLRAMERRAIVEALERRLLALLDAWLVEELALRGVPARCLVPAAADLDLRADLQRLLAWQLWPVNLRLGAYLARHGDKHRSQRALGDRIARQFEAAVPRLARVLADLFARFRRHLYGLGP